MKQKLFWADLADSHKAGRICERQRKAYLELLLRRGNERYPGIQHIDTINERRQVAYTPGAPIACQRDRKAAR